MTDRFVIADEGPQGYVRRPGTYPIPVVLRVVEQSLRAGGKVAVWRDSEAPQ